MGNDSKRWEDERSMEGLGLLQDLIGEPHDPLLTKGALKLKYAALTAEEQAKTARAVEEIVRRMPDGDFRIIGGAAHDGGEILEKMQENLSSALREHLNEMAYTDWQRNNEEIRRHQESEEGRRKVMKIASAAINTLFGIEDTAGEISDTVNEIRGSVGGISGTVSRIDDSLDDLNRTAEDIGMGIIDIDRGIHDLNATQKSQLAFLGRIHETIEEHGADTNALLEEIALLASEQISATIEQQELTRDELKKMIGQALLQGIVVLREFQRKVVDAIRKGADMISETQKIVLHELRNEVTGAIRKGADKISRTQKKLAKDSERIKARQHLDQGRFFLEHGHTDEATERLKTAFSLFGPDYETNILLATAYARMGQTEEAKRHFSYAESCAATGSNPALLVDYLMEMPPEDGEHQFDQLIKEMERMGTGRLGQGRLSALAARFEPQMRRIVEEKETSRAVDGLLACAAILLASNGNDDLARKCVILVYRCDPKVVVMRQSSDFPALASYLKRVLGEHASVLKRFGDLPEELIKLL